MEIFSEEPECDVDSSGERLLAVCWDVPFVHVEGGPE